MNSSSCEIHNKKCVRNSHEKNCEYNSWEKKFSNEIHENLTCNLKHEYFHMNFTCGIFALVLNPILINLTSADIMICHWTKCITWLSSLDVFLLTVSRDIETATWHHKCHFIAFSF